MEKEKKHKFMVSIILPIYNVAAYIERCLESVCRQTISSLEIICVDDHGVDDSMAIARAYATKHESKSRHFVFLQTATNSGPGVARNVGIAKARGEYIAFLDADDWVESAMYETLYNAAKEVQSQISSSAAVMDYPDGRVRTMLNPFVGSGELTEGKRKYILRHFVSNFTTCLFARQWLVDSALQFPVSKSGEDSCFMAQCYLLATSIAQTNALFYHYVIHDDSISHRRHVWRGKEKRAAFGALLTFARKRNLMCTYWKELYWIYIKKAIVTPICEVIL